MKTALATELAIPESRGNTLQPTEAPLVDVVELANRAAAELLARMPAVDDATQSHFALLQEACSPRMLDMLRCAESDTQRAWIGMVSARARCLTDRFAGDRLDQLFRALTALSSQTRPGWVAGLKYDGWPTRGDTWGEEAEYWTDELDRFLNHTTETPMGTMVSRDETPFHALSGLADLDITATDEQGGDPAGASVDNEARAVELDDLARSAGRQLALAAAQAAFQEVETAVSQSLQGAADDIADRRSVKRIEAVVETLADLAAEMGARNLTWPGTGAPEPNLARRARLAVDFKRRLDKLPKPLAEAAQKYEEDYIAIQLGAVLGWRRKATTAALLLNDMFEVLVVDHVGHIPDAGCSLTAGKHLAAAYPEFKAFAKREAKIVGIVRRAAAHHTWRKDFDQALALAFGDGSRVMDAFYEVARDIEVLGGGEQGEISALVGRIFAFRR